MNAGDAYPVKVRKKLIEVALPLEAINRASAREKAIHHGHPSTLHLWWARRPLAAARAVIFSQMVDDPSEYVDVLRDDPRLRRKAETVLKARLRLWEEAKHLTAKAEGTGLDVPEPGPEPTLDEILADQERQRLFRIIESLVVWENTMNETVVQAARDEIWASWRRTCLDNVDHPRARDLYNRHALPAFHDPFAGGGALPLEAQRLGLESHASDLNPVAVLINKAMIEVPPRFAGLPPVNPEARSKTDHSGAWAGAEGLAEDVRHYGQWMRSQADQRIGYLYPTADVTSEMARERPDLAAYVGRSLTVVAWLWARTVRSPNPAFAQVDVPLASSFFLSAKSGKEAYVDPIRDAKDYRFQVKVGHVEDVALVKSGTTAGKWNAFRCLMSGTPISYEYIRGEGVGGRMGRRLMAVVAEGDRERIYLSPTKAMEDTANQALPSWRPELEINYHPRDIKTQIYGLTTYGDLFSTRQLVSLSAFCDMVDEARRRATQDAIDAGMADDHTPLRDGGTGAAAYGEAVSVYLGLALSRQVVAGNALVTWNSTAQKAQRALGRQTLPMSWDYCETNPLAEATGAWVASIELERDPLQHLGRWGFGFANQEDAAVQSSSTGKLVSTDPPYYDNVGYADLSDFFYVWLRRALKPVFPDLFATLAVPKAEELVATPYRHGGKQEAEIFFLRGMTQAMERLAEQAHDAFPVTIYYAYKQAEANRGEGATNTGWDTFLAAVLDAGFAVTGTWPMRTEMTTWTKGRMNTLASSIILVCRKRASRAPTATRREFVAALRAELPLGLANLQRGSIAPVDLAQAAIGPGMAVYTRFGRVLDAEGKPIGVREALSLINSTLDEVLAAQEGDFDADSRWALAWFEQFGFGVGPYGVAETLSTAKNTSVGGMAEAGILASRSGEVRLLMPAELDPAWDPATDSRRPAWQTVHQLIRAANRGETALAGLIAKLGTEADTARELAYRLYVLSERKKRTEEAGWYNGLVQSWNEALRLAAETPAQRSVQGELFGEE